MAIATILQLLSKFTWKAGKPKLSKYTEGLFSGVVEKAMESLRTPPDSVASALLGQL